MSAAAQVHALLAVALVLLAALVAQADRHRTAVAYLETELAAAETDLRAAGGSRRCRHRPAAGCPGFTWANPGPTSADLAVWAAEVDGLPWGRATDGLPADVVDDPGSCTPKLSPTAPVTTARLRRLVAA